MKELQRVTIVLILCSEASEEAGLYLLPRQTLLRERHPLGNSVRQTARLPDDDMTRHKLQLADTFF